MSCGCCSELRNIAKTIVTVTVVAVAVGSNPATATSLRNFGNSVYPALPVSFG